MTWWWPLRKSDSPHEFLPKKSLNAGSVPMKTIELQAEFPVNFPSLGKQLVKHPAAVGKSPEKPPLLLVKLRNFRIISLHVRYMSHSNLIAWNKTKPNDFDPPTRSGFEGLRKVENAGWFTTRDTTAAAVNVKLPVAHDVRHLGVRFGFHAGIPVVHWEDKLQRFSELVRRSGSLPLSAEAKDSNQAKVVPPPDTSWWTSPPWSIVRYIYISNIL